MSNSDGHELENVASRVVSKGELLRHVRITSGEYKTSLSCERGLSRFFGGCVGRFERLQVCLRDRSSEVELLAQRDPCADDKLIVLVWT